MFGWDSLTEAEYSVTELVAEGLTNREVATRLFLSPHTVDSHLRHIFRKLDISSRMDLVRIVTARSLGSRALDDAAYVRVTRRRRVGSLVPPPGHCHDGHRRRDPVAL